MLKPWIAAAVLSALLAPVVGALTASKHECTDHVCWCKSTRSPERSGPRPCHDSGRPAASDCDLRSRCTHEPPVLVTGGLYLAPSVAVAAPAQAAQTIDAAPARRPLAGVLQVVSPPPKAS